MSLTSYLCSTVTLAPSRCTTADRTGHRLFRSGRPLLEQCGHGVAVATGFRVPHTSEFWQSCADGGSSGIPEPGEGSRYAGAPL